MASASTTTSAPRARIPDLAAKFLDYLESTPVQQANLDVFGGIRRTRTSNRRARSRSISPGRKIFGQFNDVFVNGDQAFPLDVTTEYFRVINEVASDHLDPKSGCGRTAEVHRAAKIGASSRLGRLQSGRPRFSVAARYGRAQPELARELRMSGPESGSRPARAGACSSTACSPSTRCSMSCC